MKIVILRGGERRPVAPALVDTRIDTADAGATAIISDSRWALVNVSAAVARQLETGVPALSAAGLDEPDVRAVVLTDAQLEHVGGLLSLRRGAPIDLYATPAVFEELATHLPVLPALQHYCGVHWRVIPVAGDRREAEFAVQGLPSLEFTALATESAPWPHAAPQRAPAVGDSIALVVRDRASGRTAFCAPGLCLPGASELAWIRQCDTVLMAEPRGPGISAEQGDNWFEVLGQLPARHKLVYTRRGADARGPFGARGIAPALDGVEIEL